MDKYLKRNAYERLLLWKKSEHHATLEVSGARQVGKTYIVNKFADEQYRRKIYINLLDFTGELFLERYKELRNEILHGLQCVNPVYELIKRAYPDFVDSSDTVVIIDEIQESADIYNRIREFTRELKSDFIITGSYLGRILNKEFKYSAGDLDSLEIHTLDFEEFLKACGEEGSKELVVYHGSCYEFENIDFNKSHKIFFPGQKNFRQGFAKLKYRWLQRSRLKMSRYSLFCVYRMTEQTHAEK